MLVQFAGNPTWIQSIRLLLECVSVHVRDEIDEKANANSKDIGLAKLKSKRHCISEAQVLTIIHPRFQ